MIRTSSGELMVECNECGTEQPGGTLEFREFVKDIKDRGWKTRKVGQTVDTEWQHYCPDCAAEMGMT